MTTSAGYVIACETTVYENCLSVETPLVNVRPSLTVSFGGIGSRAQFPAGVRPG